MKTITTSLVLFFGLIAGAQTHFNQVVGENFVQYLYYTNSGFGSVKLPSGDFMTVSMSESHGFQLKRFDVSGSLQFTKEVSHPLFVIYSVYSFEEYNNSLYISGYSIHCCTNYKHFYLAKIDLNTYAVTFVEKPFISGGMNYTFGPDINVSSDGIFVSFPELSRLEISRYDLNLNHQWTKTCEPDPTSGKNPATDCGRLDDSTIIVLGKVDSDVGCGEYDTSGRLDTLRIFEPDSTYYTRMYSMTKTADNNIVMGGLYYDIVDAIAGSQQNIPLLTKISRHGSIIWSKELTTVSGIPLFERFVKVIELANGNIVAFATKFDSWSDTYADGLVVFDSNGNQLFSKCFGDPITQYKFYDIKPYNDGVLLSGVIEYDIGPSYMTKNFMAFTDFNFTQLCHVTDYSLPFIDHSMGNVVTYNGNDYTNNDGTAITTNNYGTFTPAADPLIELCTISSVNEKDESVKVSFYPNPVDGESVITITLSEANNYSIIFTDITGKSVRSTYFSGNILSLNISEFTSGVYLMNITSEGKPVTIEKLLVK